MGKTVLVLNVGISRERGAGKKIEGSGKMREGGGIGKVERGTISNIERGGRERSVFSKKKEACMQA